MKLFPALTTTLALAYGLAQTTPNVAESLHMKLSFRHDLVAIDSVIEPEITFVNVGADPFYVRRSDSIGRDHIQIIAKDASCEYTTSSVRATMQASHQRFLLTPLRPGERYSQPLIPINAPDAPGNGELLVPHEGPYSVRVVFRSEGETVVDGFGPVWRGTASSDPVTLIVLAPARGKVDRMRAQLEVSVKTGTVDPDSIAYFRRVRDQGAADLLVQLVGAEPLDPWLAEAIAHQRRSRDADALEILSRHLSRSDPRSAEYAAELAKRLRTAAPCDQL